MTPAAARIAFESARQRGVEVSVIWRSLDGVTHHAVGHVVEVADDHVLLTDEKGPLHIESVEDVRHRALPPSST